MHIDIKFFVDQKRIQSLRVSVEHISMNLMIQMCLPTKVFHVHMARIVVVYPDDMFV